MSETLLPLKEKTQEERWKNGLEQIEDLCQKPNAETQTIDFGNDNGTHDPQYLIKATHPLTNKRDGLSLVELKDGRVGYAHSVVGENVVFLFVGGITLDIAKKIFKDPTTLTDEENKIHAKAMGEEW